MDYMAILLPLQRAVRAIRRGRIADSGTISLIKTPKFRTHSSPTADKLESDDEGQRKHENSVREQ
jgi:hypothetical protein